jgi:hypothetical protein
VLAGTTHTHAPVALYRTALHPRSLMHLPFSDRRARDVATVTACLGFHPLRHTSPLAGCGKLTRAVVRARRIQLELLR